MLDMYVKPWGHAGPYFLGIIIGYYLVNEKIPKLTASVKFFGWFCVITTWLIIHYFMWKWNNNQAYSTLSSLLFASTFRLAYSAIIGWLIIICLTGQATWIDSVLSWKVWVPLSRSTYMVYLCHMWFIWMYVGFKRSIMDCD